MGVNVPRVLLMVAVACCMCVPTRGWESYELDLFDLVEDVNQNFYEFFDIKPVGVHFSSPA